jgi:acetate kinase
MEKILALNIGSRTIKWAIFNGQWLEEGIKEEVKNFDSSLKEVLSKIKKRHFIDAVSHRIVHGGEIKKNTLVSEKILKYLISLEKFAPLHQKNGVKGIEVSKKIFPKAKQIAVFDTEFHATMPEKARIYAIPFRFYKKGIKRYGFHGISHRFVMEKVGKKAKRLVSCHLGAGCSITAIKNGRSIDTSMGFTPLEGIVMMTRSGSIDPGILIYLKNENLNELLNEKSGVYGICGIKDFRDVLKSRDKKAKLAIEIFCYSVSKQIGAYAAVLGGLDGVAFTGGIGENSSIIRNKILEYIKFLKPKVFIIKSDEKEILLKEALKLLKH